MYKRHEDGYMEFQVIWIYDGMRWGGGTLASNRMGFLYSILVDLLYDIFE